MTGPRLFGHSVLIFLYPSTRHTLSSSLGAVGFALSVPCPLRRPALLRPPLQRPHQTATVRMAREPPLPLASPDKNRPMQRLLCLAGLATETSE